MLADYGGCLTTAEILFGYTPFYLGLKNKKHSASIRADGCPAATDLQCEENKIELIYKGDQLETFDHGLVPYTGQFDFLSLE